MDQSKLEAAYCAGFEAAKADKPFYCPEPFYTFRQVKFWKRGWKAGTNDAKRFAVYPKRHGPIDPSVARKMIQGMLGPISRPFVTQAFLDKVIVVDEFTRPAFPVSTWERD
jgi:hypothetical protein